MNTQKVVFETSEGQFARVRFMSLFKAGEWQAIQTAFAKGGLQHLQPEAYAALSRLVVQPESLDMGWWQPYAMEKKSVSNDLPAGVATSFHTLGWMARDALRPYEKQILAFIDAREVDTDIGRNRQYSRDYQCAVSNPFAGWAVIQRLMQGGTVKIESVEDMIQAQCAVIYCPTADGYLDAQNGYRELNRARIFPSAHDARQHIESHKRFAGCLVGEIAMRLEGFDYPERLGPKARAAMSFRNAEQLGDATAQVAAPTAKRRRI